ncbi:hypothetical protein [Pacificoceanicola onchidii]|uniref:hypothetical protein n=1 Tax=Pacificoceanicola onchidii TaxID=2562685 RepID=UPI0010A4AB89|nr:hypothetical protein [Pacificoceanicola onchidii]
MKRLLLALLIAGSPALAEDVTFEEFMTGGLHFTDELTEGAAFFRSLPVEMQDKILVGLGAILLDLGGQRLFLDAGIMTLGQRALMELRFPELDPDNGAIFYRVFREKQQLGEHDAYRGALVGFGRFGRDHIGLEAAAQGFFGKPTETLNDHELAYCLGHGPDLLIAYVPPRRELRYREQRIARVWNDWVDQGLITVAEGTDAVDRLTAETLALQTLPE